MKLIEWIIDRLKEKSTWAGIGVLLGLVGVRLSPDALSSVMAAVVAIIGVWEVIRRENP